jgi:hypothetical protein
MRALGALVLGIVIGVIGLLILQHPRSIDVIGAALGVTTSPPKIWIDSPGPNWCDANPQAACK